MSTDMEWIGTIQSGHPPNNNSQDSRPRRGGTCSVGGLTWGTLAPIGLIRVAHLFAFPVVSLLDSTGFDSGDPC
jgi:hypothetical protein